MWLDDIDRPWQLSLSCQLELRQIQAQAGEPRPVLAERRTASRIQRSRQHEPAIDQSPLDVCVTKDEA